MRRFICLFGIAESLAFYDFCNTGIHLKISKLANFNILYLVSKVVAGEIAMCETCNWCECSIKRKFKNQVKAVHEFFFFFWLMNRKFVVTGTCNWYTTTFATSSTWLMRRKANSIAANDRYLLWKRNLGMRTDFSFFWIWKDEAGTKTCMKEMCDNLKRF